MNSSKIITGIITILIAFLLGYCSNENEVKIQNKTIEKVIVKYDTLLITHNKPVIKYRDRLITDTLILDKGIKQVDSITFSSKPFTAIDSVKGNFGKIITKFNYPELLFDYDIYAMDTTYERTIYINKEQKLHWTQQEWFIYTTNAISLITGVIVGSKATR